MRVVLLVVASLLALVSRLALAGWDFPTVVRSGSGGVVVQPSMRSVLIDAVRRQAAIDAVSGGVSVKGPVTLPVGSTAVVGSIGRTLSQSALLRGAVRVAGLAGPGIAIGLVLEAIRCRADGTSIAGILECDPLADMSQQQGYEYSNPWMTPTYSSDAHAVCEDLAGHRAAQSGVELSGSSPIGGTPYTGCEYTYRYTCPGDPGGGPKNCTATAQASGWYSRSALVEACPQGSQPIAGQPGKCTRPEDEWIPVPSSYAEDRVDDWKGAADFPSIDPPSLAEEIGQRLDGSADPNPVWSDAEAPSTGIQDGPASVPGETTTTTTNNPDGSSSETTTTTTHNITYQGDTYNVTTTTVTSVQNYDAQGQPVGSPTTTTTTTNPPPVPSEEPEDLECGLPGYPKCQIDETGTPEAGEAWSDPGDAVQPLQDIVAEPVVPDAGWTFTIELPSSCTPYAAGDFAGVPVVVDLCAYQDIIHQLMSMVWAAATLFVLIGMVGRTFGTGG